MNLTSNPESYPLRLERVTFSYGVTGQSSKPIFSGMDLAVAPGEYVGVIGPSGCGKSTLVRLACGMAAPASGKVTVFGHPPEHVYSSRRIGLSLQDQTLVPWLSALRNVELPGDRDDVGLRARAFHLLDCMGLASNTALLANELSGGMRARVALARALVNEPSLLVLDEPFAALDELTAVDVCKQLVRTTRHTPTSALIVSHNLDAVARLTDRCLCLNVPGREQPIEVDMASFGEPGLRSEDRVRDARALLLSVYTLQ